ncbi:hypothetical protein ABCS02_28060 [Microbacterium sp. X-17]|uniref:hypothetical protein n=1 Tax=Microbacterium sp. X-17 TaxID=3144404 RepID=UPI0031F49202
MQEHYGIRLFVLRGADRDDATLGGISSKHHRLTLIGVVHNSVGLVDRHDLTPIPRPLGTLAQLNDAPPVGLEVRTDYRGRYATLAPAEFDQERGVWHLTRKWSMAGGNYANTIDSRFSDLMFRHLGYPFHGALSIHDRIERR